MLWFKHDSDAGNDAKLRKLRIKYGAQGYGIFWYCLELIARNVDKNNLTFELEHDAVLIADDFKLSSELVQEMMSYMVDLGLFENTNGIITCLKMSTRTDEYTQKLINKNKKCPDNVPTISVQKPRISVLKEEKRKEEKRNIYTPPIGDVLLSDFLKVRKAKRAGELTETAFKAIEREAKKAGLTVEQAIEMCCLRGWVGFYARWVDSSNEKQDEIPEWKRGML